MNKNMIYNFLISLIILLSGILWLLAVAIPDIFGWFNVSFFVATATGGIAMIFFVKGAFKKESTSYKKANIFLGAGLLLICIFSLIWAFVLPANFIAPIVCIVVSFGICFGLLATKGEQWDKGDNQKQDYKDYFQRKTEKDENK